MKRPAFYYSLQCFAMAAFLMLPMLPGCSSSEPDPEPTVEEEEPLLPTATKTNPMKLYMHYMPWFQSKPVSGYWGSHWTMTNKNPDVIEDNGQRQIASHYHPIIGPYDSKDTDVLDYHLLLMKYAGVDGILVDWYGTYKVYDYYTNFQATEALVKQAESAGVQFAMVYEDYTAQVVAPKLGITGIDAAKTDMKFLSDNYFKNKYHIAIDKKPLLLTFGPRYFKDMDQWTDIFKDVTKPAFLPLWDHAGFVGNNGSGQFAWVDFNASLSQLNSFYNKKGNMSVLMGSAYPRFHDFYKEGGTGNSYGYVDFNDGQTFSNTLAKAKEYNLDYLQLVTWNDFGEGTVIEPTTEDQYKCLEILQQFAGVAYTRTELEMVHEYYLKKIKYKGNDAALATLKQTYQHLVNLEVEQARNLLKTLE
ncbi:glycoside hydrolase family 71/99-like protein [Chryseolinea lacunae]|uniref:Glycosyl hydrolase family 99 n=1 Tax=Chryseolinea lacunae TaxID=2801331 RepID=A0ABS1KYV6_9BACT|nr:glycoside hydrolase family 71/99-like protein [Chryseolinea lacunae]MBL0744458.1 hypothetical protein [Chryseolinea lacunae]